MYINSLIQIKNAQQAKMETVKIPYSKINEQVVDILVKNGYLENSDKKGRSPKKIIDIKLKYDDNKGVINDIRLISKSSRRVYIGYKDIRPSKQGYGLLVLSTPKGIMTGKEARKSKMGGELMFEIW